MEIARTIFGFALVSTLAVAVLPVAHAQKITEIRLLEMGGVSGEAVQAAYLDPFNARPASRWSARILPRWARSRPWWRRATTLCR